MADLSPFNIENTVMKTLGIEIVEYTLNEWWLPCPLHPKLISHLELCMGSIRGDCGNGGFSRQLQFIDPSTHYAVGLEINANHIRSQRDGMVKAIGTPFMWAHYPGMGYTHIQ